jgi:hypothetical protein
MATEIYKLEEIVLIDGTVIEISPLKIRYLREFMDTFEKVKESKSDDETMSTLANCVRIAMKQYHPIMKTTEDVEDNLDLPTIYKVVDIAANIKINEKSEEPVRNQMINNSNSNGSSWETLDLAKLETEIFTLGIWKNYQELEASMSISELLITLESRRDLDYQEKKFLAAIQGVDIEANKSSQTEVDPWEAMKARVAAKESGIGNGDPNDITALQGQKAQQMGFGIGMGLDYENLT